MQVLWFCWSLAAWPLGWAAIGSLPELIATLQMLAEVGAAKQSEAQKTKTAARYMLVHAS